MGFLQNNWLNYWDRSYEQIKAQILTRMQQRVPEITDHTESNLFVKIVSIFAAIAEMLGYYTDNAAREAHLDSARLYGSGISHARRNDYRVRGKLPANTDVVFSVPEAQVADIIIPANTLVSSTLKDISFLTVGSVTIPADELVSPPIGVTQIYSVDNVSLGFSDGSPKQEFVVGDDVADNTVIVRVGTETWTRRDSMVASIPTSKYYTETVNRSGQHVIIFGDGIAGAIPEIGLEINVDYKGTDGVEGNVEAGDLDQHDFTFADTQIDVTNPAKAVGGSGVETLDQLKRRIPLQHRTNNRAVTPQDYIDIAELAPGVAKAGRGNNKATPIDLYIVPDGGGLANSVLLAAVTAWFDTKKIVGRVVRVFSAGEVRPRLVINVTAWPNYRNADVENAIKAELLDFISYKHQEIQGELQIGDVYQHVENTPGVKHSTVIVMTTVPYARPLNLTTPQLVWTRAIKQASLVPVTWKIVFLDEENFQLYKNNGYIGDFTYGSLVDMPEFSFTIPDKQLANNQWEFTTYPYFGSLKLQEPSILAAYPDDLTINVTGGL